MRDSNKYVLNSTLMSRLIQAVRKKTAGSHVGLRGNISAPVWITDLVEVSKDSASLVVCTRKLGYNPSLLILWMTCWVFGFKSYDII